MNIAPAKDASKAPRTRRELLAHVWSSGVDCNVFKEGAFYAVRLGHIVSATHVRAINDLSFDGWIDKINNVAKKGALI